VADDDLAACVSCGLCLPHCPTYRVTGDEAASPRGRIAAMRLVAEGRAEPDAEFAEAIESCVQCRACETACPSSVPFGRLVAGARATLAAQRGVPLLERLALATLGHHGLLLAGSSALALAQRTPAARLLPPALRRPLLPLRRPRLPAGRGPMAEGAERQRATRRGTVGRGAPRPEPDAWLFTGCVMDAWLRESHVAVLTVLSATGAVVRTLAGEAPCCGALHHHAGLVGPARSLASRVVRAVPGEAPVLVDSAGCGAELKAYGELLGTDDGRRFAARVRDVHEWLVEEGPDGRRRLDRLPERRGERPVVAVVDPCHLRHAQRAHHHVRTVLARYADLVELDDEGACCGAGGGYALVRPRMAAAVRDRKLAALRRAGASRAVAANPGCILHLRAAGVPVVHPLEVVSEALQAAASRSVGSGGGRGRGDGG
jgi:glycolate oxidase iron-sulfur subunit